jgi:hypothetical protein
VLSEIAAVIISGRVMIFTGKYSGPVRGHYRCAECFREWPVHTRGENTRYENSAARVF